MDWENEVSDFCDDCQVNSAIVHLTHVENNEAQTFHLCEDCARKRGIPFPDGETLLKGLEALAGAALGEALGSAAQVKVTVKKPVKEVRGEVEADAVCPVCGLKLSEFRSVGWLGCAECYSSFDEQIEKILVQVHGAGGHRGKRYGRPAVRGRGGSKRDLERLRKDLDKAIKGEEFERAAAIRDTIRGLGQGVK